MFPTPTRLSRHARGATASRPRCARSALATRARRARDAMAGCRGETAGRDFGAAAVPCGDGGRFWRADLQNACRRLYLCVPN